MSAEHTAQAVPQPKKAELANVPQIGSLLGIERGSQEDVRLSEFLKDHANKGIFAGEAIVRLGLRTQEQLDAALENQTYAISMAASNDIQDIAYGTSLEFPAFLQPHWGNGGVVNAVT